jgi:hypothetical protein
MRPHDTTAGRFWAKVNKDGPVPTNQPDLGPCWLWTATLNTSGYGHIWTGDRYVLAHRWAYISLRGPISADVEIDHLCQVKRCVNPGHMELVSHGENLRRSAVCEWTAAKRRARTHCIHGHAYDEANTYWYHNARICRTCHIAGQRAYRLRRVINGGLALR